MEKKIRSSWRTLSGIVLVFSLMLVTCSLNYEEGPTIKADVLSPIITAQPTGSKYWLGETYTPLTIAANSPDNGKLNYQWFKASAQEHAAGTGTAAEGAGATTASFTPGITEEGTYTYYVRVTNTKDDTTGKKSASVNSNLVTVQMNDPQNAQYPEITAAPEGGYYALITSTTLMIEPIEVSAEVETDRQSGATLTYQWYSSITVTNEGGEAIDGAIAASYTPDINGAATMYYYVEITNTWDAAPGRNKSKSVSNPIMVKVIAANATFSIDADAKYQYVRGFGGMSTPWDNAPQEYVADYEKMYSPDGLGFNILRIMILPYNTDIDLTMKQLISNELFPLGNSKTILQNGLPLDRSIYYNLVKIVNKYDGYVLASPWSPPADWKTNDDIVGGKLKPQNYQDFADYLKRFCQHMYERGVPIYAVSMQNEPSWKANDGRPECEYTQIEHRDWWKQVGHFTTGAPGWGGGMPLDSVKTMSGEAHNEIAWLNAAITDPDVRNVIDIWGRHIYGAGINPVDWNGYGQEIWMSEHNINSGNEIAYPNDSTWNYIWKFMNEIDLTIRLNNESAFIWWTNTRFYSFVGDGMFGTTAGTILPRGYAMSHYAKFAKEMQRVQITAAGTTGGGGAIDNSNFNSTSYNVDSTAVKATAFASEDGNTISLVMFSPTNASGTSGVNMGTIKIQLPEGFEVVSATSMRSTEISPQPVTEEVIICKDKNSAIVTLPDSNILSVRFSK